MQKDKENDNSAIHVNILKLNKIWHLDWPSHMQVHFDISRHMAIWYYRDQELRNKANFLVRTRMKSNIKYQWVKPLKIYKIAFVRMTTFDIYKSFHFDACVDSIYSCDRHMWRRYPNHGGATLLELNQFWWILGVN